MNFSKTPPSTPGFYAWKFGDTRYAVSVFVGARGLLCCISPRTGELAICETMGGEWCRLVPAEELLKMRDEFTELIWRENLSFETAWKLSRAKRVMEGKE